MTPYTITVTLTPGHTLNERGLEALDEAIERANLTGEISDAVVEALHRELPKERDFEFLDWFRIRVEETS